MTKEPIDTSWGATFVAPCQNIIETDFAPYERRCLGFLRFGPYDGQAACDKCGASCGRLVAFHESPSQPESHPRPT